MSTDVISQSVPEDAPARRVLMLGTSPATRGGIASVVRAYRSGGLFADWPITYLATHADGGHWRKLGVALSAWARFGAWLVRRRDFLLHVHAASRASFWRKSAFILPAAWRRRPVIFHLHGGEFMRFYEDECGTLARRYVRYVLRRCTRIIVLSGSWREALESITSTPVDVIGNFAPSFSLSRQRVPGRILFLGRLCEGKGIFLLLEAFAKLSGEHPDAHLVCAGDGDLDAVRALAKRLGIEDRVEVAGWIDGNCKAELLATASLYVLPSFAEGMPMSVLEAMSAGLPVVATPVGGIPDAVAHGEEGLLVPAGDLAALCDAVGSLLADPQRRQAMGTRARAKFASSFSSSAVLPKVGRIYRELGVRRRQSGEAVGVLRQSAAAE
ncbi:MAG TPA: glycosyltransferase family 4 protein [Woeseiaceae bacterium]|nr:glycosyltransferase family 4 protein [Woeseiaceae bacterium]